jgi:hypothetical protein
MSDYVLTPMKREMAASIIFMPEIDHLTAGVTKEVIERLYRVAIKYGAVDPEDEPEVNDLIGTSEMNHRPECVYPSAGPCDCR